MFSSILQSYEQEEGISTSSDESIPPFDTKLLLSETKPSKELQQFLENNKFEVCIFEVMFPDFWKLLFDMCDVEKLGLLWDTSKQMQTEIAKWALQVYDITNDCVSCYIRIFGHKKGEGYCKEHKFVDKSRTIIRPQFQEPLWHPKYFDESSFVMLPFEKSLVRIRWYRLLRGLTASNVFPWDDILSSDMDWYFEIEKVKTESSYPDQGDRLDEYVYAWEIPLTMMAPTLKKYGCCIMSHLIESLELEGCDKCCWDDSSRKAHLARAQNWVISLAKKLGWNDDWVPSSKVTTPCWSKRSDDDDD